ncbi:MAG: xanthine dehydrogenase subunit D, partial [Acidimicrobiales bacterium]
MTPTSPSTDVQAPPAGGRSASGARIGDSPIRPDGTPKVQGRFAFASDLEADGMLWGRTLRSPHPYARVRSVDIGPALAIAGVSCVLTADDVPGASTYGLISPDQPVLARGVVRYVGEPVAALAADHPDTARRALTAIVVDYEPLDPLVDPARATSAETPPIHPDGNVIRHIRLEHGDPAATGDVVVEGVYEVGMQDQAFL